MQADLIFGGVSGGGAESLGAGACKQLRRAGCDSRASEEHRIEASPTQQCVYTQLLLRSQLVRPARRHSKILRLSCCGLLLRWFPKCSVKMIGELANKKQITISIRSTTRTATIGGKSVK
jgi:hypothetical protein